MEYWNKISEKVIIKDEWIELRADKCALPNGKEIFPYYVLEVSDWVHILAMNSKEEILVIQQYRYAGNCVCLELPGGGVEFGESPLEAAKRELKEETGYVAEAWKKIASPFANPARQTNRVHCFLASELRDTKEKHLDETEDIYHEFLPVSEVMRKIYSGEFSQALHIASFLLGVEQLKRTSQDEGYDAF